MRSALILAAALTATACTTADFAGHSKGNIHGQKWTAESINGRSVLDNTEITMTIAEDGKMRGTAGCQSYVAKAFLEGSDEIGVGALAISKQGCHGAKLDQQMRFVRAMMLAERYEMNGANTLYVYSEGEGKPLTFKASKR
ncbi:MAG: META domain-containing protein [Pseudomonadota bacterium]